MAKEIRYFRTEYVREDYQVSWNEKDYQNLIQWLSERKDNHNTTRYEVLKDLSFDDIAAIMNNEKDDIPYELICNSGENQWSHKEYVGDYIREQMQEDAWNMGCYDSECYDAEDHFEIEN